MKFSFVFVLLAIVYGVAMVMASQEESHGHDVVRQFALSGTENEGEFVVSFEAFGESFRWNVQKLERKPFAMEVDGVRKHVEGRGLDSVTILQSKDSVFPFFTLRDGQLHKGHFLRDSREHIIEPFWLYRDVSPEKDAVAYLESLDGVTDYSLVVYDTRAIEHTKHCHCGHDHDHDSEEKTFSERAVPDLNNLASNVRYVSPVPSPCPSTTQEMTIGIAVDHEAYDRMGGSTAAVEAEVSDLMVFLSAEYVATANVRLNLQELVIRSQAGGEQWNSQSCPDVSTKLRQFTEWRRDRANHGLWHLLTHCYLSGTVGLAWMGVNCQTQVYNNPDGTPWSNTGVSSYIANTGHAVVAHEIGHNCGASHAQDGLMTASVSNTDQFSAETQTALCSGFSTRDSCLSSTSCSPNCAGLSCGTDGCGGSCGTCSSSQNCVEGVCEAACVPNCSGKQCGSNGCGGSCGTCGTSSFCNSNSQCEATTATDGSDLVAAYVNAERSSYDGLSSIAPSSSLTSQAANAIAGCQFGTLNQGAFSTGYYALMTARSPTSSSSSTDVIQSVLSAGRDAYQCSTDQCSNANCNLYRALISQGLSAAACAHKACPASSTPFGNGQPWDYVVCAASPGTSSSHPLPGGPGSCGACSPFTSCEQQNAQCGVIFNGCESEVCGSGGCAAGASCNFDTNQCESTLSSSDNNNNNNVPEDCEPTSSETPCADMQCGFDFDGCERYECGACQEGQECVSNQCLDTCDVCSVFADCNRRSDGEVECVCQSGYSGNGTQCVPMQNKPAGSCAGGRWRKQHNGNAQFSQSMTDSSCQLSTHPGQDPEEDDGSGKAKDASGSAATVLLHPQQHTLGDEAIWAVRITRQQQQQEEESDVQKWQVGVVAGATAADAVYPNAYFAFVWDGSTQRTKFIARVPEWDWEWIVEGDVLEWPLNSAKVLSLKYLADGSVVVVLDGEDLGRYDVAGWPEITEFGVFSQFDGDETATNNTALFTLDSFTLFSQSTLVIDLWGCYSDEELRIAAAEMLNIDPAQIINIENNQCQSRKQYHSRAVAPFTSGVSITIASTETGTSSAALTSKFSATVSSGAQGSPLSGTVTAQASSLPVASGTPAASAPSVPSGGGGGGGGLSSGAIAGIVVGSVAGAALIAGGAYVVLSRNQDDHTSSDGDRKSWRQSVAGIFSKPSGGVDVSPSGHSKSGHKSLTARHPGYVNKN